MIFFAQADSELINLKTRHAVRYIQCDSYIKITSIVVSGVYKGLAVNCISHNLFHVVHLRSPFVDRLGSSLVLLLNEIEFTQSSAMKSPCLSKNSVSSSEISSSNICAAL